MSEKTPIITLSSNDTNITIKQDSVHVDKVYNLTVGRKTLSYTIPILNPERGGQREYPRRDDYRFYTYRPRVGHILRPPHPIKTEKRHRRLI